MLTVTINGKPETIDLPPDTPILWVLRDQLGLTGTKFSCGISACGACTVHVNGEPVRACTTPIAAAENKTILTIEAMAEDPVGKKLQAAWLELSVPQCGYCQPGQIMSAAALLKRNAKPGDADINQAMQGNLCRCGTYTRIRAAIKQAAENS